MRDKSLPASQVPFISKPLKAAFPAVKLFSLGRIQVKKILFCKTLILRNLSFKVSIKKTKRILDV